MRAIVFSLIPSLMLGVATANSVTPAGIWQGTYTCAQGLTGLSLSVIRDSSNKTFATFSFFAIKSNPRVPTGVFEMTGSFDPTTRKLILKPLDWLARPSGYEMVQLNGIISADNAVYSGRVSPMPGASPCKTFNLKYVPVPTN